MSNFSNEIKTTIVVSEDSITFYPPCGYLWSNGCSSIGYEITNTNAAMSTLALLKEPLLKDNRI